MVEVPYPPYGSGVLARMIDIGTKPHIERTAVAEGSIALRPATLRKIRARKIKKGDVLTAAQLAGIMAAKRTPDIIPLCHLIPVTGVSVDVQVEDCGVRCTCEVKARYGTGVEMEALAGTVAALLCVWDMVKYLEKDGTGNYPSTVVTGIRVIRKTKGKTARKGTRR